MSFPKLKNSIKHRCVITVSWGFCGVTESTPFPWVQWRNTEATLGKLVCVLLSCLNDCGSKTFSEEDGGTIHRQVRPCSTNQVSPQTPVYPRSLLPSEGDFTVQAIDRVSEVITLLHQLCREALVTSANWSYLIIQETWTWQDFTVMSVIFLLHTMKRKAKIIKSNNLNTF